VYVSYSPYCQPNSLPLVGSTPLGLAKISIPSWCLWRLTTIPGR